MDSGLKRLGTAVKPLALTKRALLELDELLDELNLNAPLLIIEKEIFESLEEMEKLRRLMPRFKSPKALRNILTKTGTWIDVYSEPYVLGNVSVLIDKYVQDDKYFQLSIDAQRNPKMLLDMIPWCARYNLHGIMDSIRLSGIPKESSFISIRDAMSNSVIIALEHGNYQIIYAMLGKTKERKSSRDLITTYPLFYRVQLYFFNADLFIPALNELFPGLLAIVVAYSVQFNLSEPLFAYANWITPEILTRAGVSENALWQLGVPYQPNRIIAITQCMQCTNVAVFKRASWPHERYCSQKCMLDWQTKR